MNRIKRVSILFQYLFQILLIAAPVLLLVSWIYAPEPLILVYGFIQMHPIPESYTKHIIHTLTHSEKLFGFLLSMIPMGIMMFILSLLIKLFKLYAQGQLFSLKHVNYIRNIGYALLLSQLISPIYQFLMGVVVTWGNPPGHRFAAITLTQTNIGIVLIAMLVILIAWIMAEGFKLQEEHQLTI